jgi:hypothetical protein
MGAHVKLNTGYVKFFMTKTPNEKKKKKIVVDRKIGEKKFTYLMFWGGKTGKPVTMVSLQSFSTTQNQNFSKIQGELYTKQACTL